MMYYIRGRLEELYKDHAVIDCGGVGYSAMISLSTYDTLVKNGGIGADGEATGIDVKLYTMVKMVDQTLFEMFGFISQSELNMFKLLQTVSGIGTRAAMAVLSVLNVGEVCTAILYDDTTAIVAAQGVGQKAAQKICIELKGKIEKFIVENNVDLSGGSDFGTNVLAVSKEKLSDNQKLAVDALVNLGYSRPQANKAVSNADGRTPEDIIRNALRFLS